MIDVEAYATNGRMAKTIIKNTSRVKLREDVNCRTLHG